MVYIYIYIYTFSFYYVAIDDTQHMMQMGGFGFDALKVYASAKITAQNINAEAKSKDKIDTSKKLLFY